MRHRAYNGGQEQRSSIHGEEIVGFWSEFTPELAYAIRSPEGDLLPAHGDPGGHEATATFFAHAPSEDGELRLAPGDWVDGAPGVNEAY